MNNHTEHQHEPFPVLIIGGGLAGLTAAAHLAERGIPPLVIDADQLWLGGRLAGGKADTFTWGGRDWSFIPDHGVHAIWGGYHNLRATLERFTQTKLRDSGGEAWINRWRREVRAVEAGNAVRGTWIPAPFHYLQLLLRPRFWRTIAPYDFLSLPGFLVSLLWTTGLDPLREQVALDGLTLDDYFRGWTPNLRATFTGLGVNLLAARKEDISLTAFLAALRFYTVLRRDSWRMQFLPGNSHDHLIQPLIDAIKARGGAVWHGITAARLERCALGWRIIVEDAARRGLRTLYTQHVILATNAPAAQRLLSTGDTAAEAAKLRFPSAVRNASVRLWFSGQPNEGAASGMFTGDFLPDNFFWLHRLYDEFAEWREAGGSAIEVHLYASDEILNQPERVLLIQCVDEVQRAFPELKGKFVHGAVRLNTRNHTRFRVPTADMLHVDTAWDNLYACGDWVGHPSPAFWMERAAVTGIAAANRVLEAHHLAPFEELMPLPPELPARALGALVRGGRVIIGRPLRALARKLKRKKRPAQV